MCLYMVAYSNNVMRLSVYKYTFIKWLVNDLHLYIHQIMHRLNVCFFEYRIYMQYFLFAIYDISYKFSIFVPALLGFFLRDKYKL